MASAKTKGMVALVIGLTVAGSLIVPLDDVIAGGTGTVNQVDNVTAQNNTYVELTGYDIQTVNSVTDSQGNAVDSGNYTVDNAEGRIRFDTSGVVSDGETVTVDYDYQATDGSTTVVAGLAPLLAVLLLLVKLANKVTGMQS